MKFVYGWDPLAWPAALPAARWGLLMVDREEREKFVGQLRKVGCGKTLTNRGKFLC